MSQRYLCGICAQSTPLFNRAAVQWTVKSPRWLLSHQTVLGSICAVDQWVFPISVFSMEVSSLSWLFPDMSLQTLPFVCIAAAPRQLRSVFRNMWGSSSLPRSTHQAPERTLSVILPEKGRWANRHGPRPPSELASKGFIIRDVSNLLPALCFQWFTLKKQTPYQCVTCWRRRKPTTPLRQGWETLGAGRNQTSEKCQCPWLRASGWAMSWRRKGKTGHVN